MKTTTITRRQLRQRLPPRADGDLYRAILTLEPGYPKSRELSDLIVAIAQDIIRLFPNRIQTELAMPMDARIIVMEFSDHPDTTPGDILRVV